MAKPGNPRKERGRGEREGGDREGEREREAGRDGGARAKPGNQLVYYNSVIVLYTHVACSSTHS